MNNNWWVGVLVSALVVLTAYTSSLSIASEYEDSSLSDLRGVYLELKKQRAFNYLEANEALLSSAEPISKYKFYIREANKIRAKQLALKKLARDILKEDKCEEVYLYHMPSNPYPQIAYNISGCNKEFMYMLSGENINFDPTTKVWDSKGYAYGFCQFNDAWHSGTIFNEKFKDPEWQLQECYNHWKGGTKFYGYNKNALSL